MNANDLLDIVGEAKEGYVLDAVKTRTWVQPVRKRLSISKVVLIAAVMALALLLVGCTVAYVLSLQELKIAEQPGVRNFNAEGEWAGPTEVTEDVISIRGYPGSPNQLATQEWYEFLQTYDPNYDLMPNENENGIPDNFYYAYNCYTWDMVDKAQEIADKYNLKLLSPELVIQRWQIGVMFDALGISGVCHEEKTAKINNGAGVFYPEGNFKYEFEFYLPMEEGTLSPMIPATVFYTKKDYFDPDYQSMDTELYDQWNYTTADGNNILIAMNRTGGFLFAENEDANMTVTVALGATFKLNDEEGWNHRCMEQAADAINFSLKVQTPDLAGMEEKLAQADAEYEEAQNAASSKARQSYASYADYIRERYIDNRDELIGTPYIRDYYALVDVTGDGQEELLLGRNDFCFNDLLTIRDGKVVAIEYWRAMNLCEGGVILCTHYFTLDGVSDDLDHPQSYEFGRLNKDTETGNLYWKPFLNLACGLSTKGWTMTNEETGEQTPIAAEDIAGILEQYPLLDIEMKPITEFPME